MGDYYVKNGGNDAADGLSDANAWETIGQVNSSMGAFSASDTISFNRGDTWSGTELTISCTGTSGNEIVFSAYGTGNDPEIQESGTWSKCITISGDYNTVEDLKLTTAHEAGVYITGDSNYVQDCEITNVGQGLLIEGDNNTARRNNVHDLNMVVNTVGGDDDYGATGCTISGNSNTVQYNQFINCNALSYDYGQDGGAVELFADGAAVDDNEISYNWAAGCNGFIEVAGNNAALSVSDNIVAYNISHDNDGIFFYIHNGGSNDCDIDNLRVENNTIVETEGAQVSGGAIGLFYSTPSASEVSFKNNIVHASGSFDTSLFSDTEFTHEYNMYDNDTGESLGLTLGTGESADDPDFVNQGADDFRLNTGSNAIDAGTSLGWSSDYAGTVVPQNGTEDLGAYEYVSGGAPSVEALVRLSGVVHISGVLHIG